MTVRVTDQVPVSWDGNNINDGSNYSSGFKPGLVWGLPDVKAKLISRDGRWPVLGGIDRDGVRLFLFIRIVGSSVRTLRDQLLGWLDPEDETSKKLIIEDDGGSGDRYVYAVCEKLQPIVSEGVVADNAFIATLAVDGDVRWRETSATTDSWSITASGQTKALTNNGKDNAYLKLTITPTGAKTDSYGYKRWVPIRWLMDVGFSSYPTDIGDDAFDTAALVETATTTTLDGALGAGETTISLTDASGFSTAGFAYITDAVNGDEQISWTGKSSNDLTGCTRGLGGTSDVAHSDLDAIAESKMLANGDDLRVWVGGVEKDRWLDGIDTATTKVWTNLDFSAKQEVTLKTAIAGAGAITAIDVNEDTSGFPSSGIVMIDSEAFTFTGKNDSLKRFSGVTRAMRGTSMAAHTVDDDVWWVQNDIWILYGNSAASTPTADDDYKPIFELDTSTNDSWVYQEFGDDAHKRTAPWTMMPVFGGGTGQYSGNQHTLTTPWEEIGLWIWERDSAGRWYLYNPCGITNGNFTNGEKRFEVSGDWEAEIQSNLGSGWITEYEIPVPSTTGAWEAWSQNQALDTGSIYVGMYFEEPAEHPSSTVRYLECADVTLTLNSSNTPGITINAEQANYSLDTEIENTTTGDKINVAFVMGLNEDLEVDSDLKTVTYKEDESSQFQALTLVGGARLDWLPLQAGSNTIKFTDVGTTGVDVDFEWDERWY